MLQVVGTLHSDRSALDEPASVSSSSILEEAAARVREIGVIGQPLGIGFTEGGRELGLAKVIARQRNGRLQPGSGHALGEFARAEDGAAWRAGRNGGKRAAREGAQPVLAN